jgi:hypothetical protein
MRVVLRLISLILIVSALMLLGADAVTSLEKGGDVTVRSLGHAATLVWTIFNKAGPGAFEAWIAHSLPSFLVGWLNGLMALPGWGVTGVIGVILAFLFGRRAGP